MRWLVDEGLPKVLVDWLEQRGDDVFDVAASKLRGVEDEELWKVAGQQRRVVITRDLGFMLPQILPQPLGVVLIRAPYTYKADAILRLVQSGVHQLPDTALYGNVTVIEPGRVRQRKLRNVAKRKPKSP